MADSLTAPASTPAGGTAAAAEPRALPRGAVTFLFTDIEGSTRLLERLGAAYEPVLDEHRRRVRAAIAAGGGTEVGTEGDSFFAAFPSPSGALLAAAEAQRSLAAGGWPPDVTVAVRMGVHTGEATVSNDDYVGIEVHRAARIAAAAHGGQVIVSSATVTLAGDRLPSGTTLRDLGDHRLKDLSRPEHLSQLVIDGLPAEFPRPRTLDATPNNLPLQLTSFIGRVELVAEARRLLGATRILTLSGPGGTGKTRIALQVAAEVVDAFPDGVFFVPLAPVTTPELVPSAILAALSLTEAGTTPPLERITTHLRTARTLLILDNFEQVLAAAPVIAGLLRTSEALKVIVTSRAVLRISGEQELPIPPLSLPDARNLPGLAALAQYEAVQLFVERALAARADFALTAENAAAVAEITARLDGLPLAIELAAARLRLLSPQAILARLGDRLALLSGGARDLPARQQTLRAAIGWSYDLLDAGECRLFERLAVFAGGWSLVAAEAVCTGGDGPAIDVFDGLTSLAEKSLVRAQDDSHGDARFLMLELIRAFAIERFEAGPEAADVRRRHAEFFLEMAERAGTALFGADRRERLTELEDEHDNIRAALAWYEARQDLPSVARMLAALWRFWQMHGHLQEARERFDRALALDDSGSLLAPAERRALLTAAGGIAYWQGSMDAAHRWYREAVDLARANEPPLALANALYDLSFAPLATTGEDWTTAIGTASKPFLDEALEIFRAAGDQAGVARTLWGLVQYYTFGNDLAEAHRTSVEALAVNREVGNAFGVAWALHSVALVKTALGAFDEARGLLLEALDLFEAADDMSGLTLLASDFASLALARGDRARGHRLAAAADAQIRRTGIALGRVSYQGPGLDPLPTGPETDAEREWWAAGAAMSLQQVIDDVRGPD
jgi:predicted ATPase/class 3 adenylate cyclase